MLNAPPPGASPSPINRQSNSLLNTPGPQGLGSTTGKMPGMIPGAPALSANPLQQQNMAMLLKLLRGGR